MHVPPELYPMETALAEHFPHLRPAQVRGLALWVCGAILAHSACQSAVVAALLAHGGYHALRQRLREWLYDGADRAAPCATALAVEGCFAPLLRWVLVWWRGDRLALAVDATLHGDRLAALVVSVLYRGGAIPVAWAILPANAPGPWLEPILGLLGRLGPAVPTGWTVLVLADRGLWSPRLWRRVRDLGWHPLLRVQNHVTFAPDGGARGTARALVRPGEAWVGRGRLGACRGQRLTVTLIAVWTAAQREPWAVVTDLPPARVGVSWYALRMWVELGFRALKGLGWRWRHTRRTDPRRTARHWLVLAVATLWVLAHGTRAEDAARLGVAPARLRTPPAAPAAPAAGRRLVSLFRLGLQCLRRLLGRGRLWRRLWLAPEPWPQPPPDLVVHVHGQADP
jgi:Transposase DDE domain